MIAANFADFLFKGHMIHMVTLPRNHLHNKERGQIVRNDKPSLMDMQMGPVCWTVSVNSTENEYFFSFLHVEKKSKEKKKFTGNIKAGRWAWFFFLLPPREIASLKIFGFLLLESYLEPKDDQFLSSFKISHDELVHFHMTPQLCCIRVESGKLHVILVGGR